MKLKTILRTGGALWLALGFGMPAQAAYINGTMQFGGGIVTLLDENDNATSNFYAARGLDFANSTLPGPPEIVLGPRVLTASGDFASVLGQVVTFDQDPWTFDQNLWSTDPGTGPLWTVGGFTFNVNSTSYTVTPLANSIALEVVGTGYVSKSGSENSSGTWILTCQQTPDNNTVTTLTWSSAASSVPDGGMTVAMLGVALMGLHGARRMFIKRRVSW